LSPQRAIRLYSRERPTGWSQGMKVTWECKAVKFGMVFLLKVDFITKNAG
jgi:hypothetical protein